MPDCPPCAPPPEGENCYPVEHPCTVYSKLENALVARAVGGGTTGYRVGEESFQFSHLSFTELKSMRDDYHAQCVACGGCPPPLSRKRRASVCFVFGDHRCRLCGASSCGCGK